MTHYASTIDTFAVNYLESCGWRKGEPLGKKKNGFSKHITVRKKSDRAGIGADKNINSNIGNHWWENVYNELISDESKNIKLKSKDEGKIYNVKESKSLMNISMTAYINTDMTFVRSTGKYGNIDAEDLIVYKEDATKKKKKEKKEQREQMKQEENVENVAKEKNDKTKESDTIDVSDCEAKHTKENRKRKRKEKNKKRKKVKKNSTSDSEEESSSIMEKYKLSTSNVLTKDFYLECNGATMKSYRQIGKEARLKMQEEKLLKEMGLL